MLEDALSKFFPRQDVQGLLTRKAATAFDTDALNDPLKKVCSEALKGISKRDALYTQENVATYLKADPTHVLVIHTWCRADMAHQMYFLENAAGVLSETGWLALGGCGCPQSRTPSRN